MNLNKNASKRMRFVLLLMSWLPLFSLSAVANEPMRQTRQLRSTRGYDTWHFAAGAGGFFSERQSVGNSSSFQMAPEVVGYGYRHLAGLFWLRPAARLSFAWNQPTMAQSFQVNEYDTRVGAELGVVWSWIVVPSLSVGTGSLYRVTSLQTTASIDASQSQMGGRSLMPLVYSQVGLGIPLAKGALLIEPYTRYVHVFGDSRYNWSTGAEATLSLY